MSTELHPRIEALIGVGSRLIELMEREIAILLDMRPGDVAELQDEKSTLTDAYETHLSVLRDEPAMLAALAPPLKDELMRVAMRLNATVAENARALDAARTANERLLKAIVDAVTAERERNAGYSRTGAKACPRPGRSAPVSLSVDTRL